MTRFESVWQGWLRLNPHERAKFRSLEQQWYDAQRGEALALRGRARSTPVAAKPLSQVKVDVLDFEAR